jgi:hypothetical protein
MPRGNVEPIPPQCLEQFVANGFAATERAGVGGWTIKRIVLGDVAIELRFVDAALADLAVRALRHLSSDEPRPTTLRVSVWDSDSTGVPLPAPMWDWHLNRYETDGVVATYDRVGRRFGLSNANTGEAMYWLASSAHYPAWEEPAPFRDILDRLMSGRGYTFLHGASIGNDERSVLLAGPSGSGKSTTVAAAVTAGLTTLGDDYVVLDPDGVRCHSLYLTTRLLDTSPAFVERGLLRASHDQKSVLLLDEHSPTALRLTLPLSAVVTPRIGDSAHTSYLPASRFAALQALAPSSLVQLDPRQSSLAKMTDLVKRLPTYELTLGHDLGGLTDSLRRLLDELGQTATP